jgi:ribosomal protein L40E
MDIFSQELIIRRLAEKITAHYILPEEAKDICACLHGHLQAGDYEECSEAEVFALALTLHLQEVNHDEHLWVRWHPEALPEEDGHLRLNPKWQDEERQRASLENNGFHKAERLPGNIGYLDIRYFHRTEWGSEAASAAMQNIANTHALIIDLRKCRGGYPGMVALVASYLFGSQPVLVDRIYWRDEDRTQEFWTSPEVPYRRYGDKPAYVLTSRATFSAGELCAHVLQANKRGTVIGEKTDGGSHLGVSYRLHPHFEAFIPIGRSIDPLTGEDMEGVGITPDISIPQAHALKAAHFLALKKIMKIEGGNPSETMRTSSNEVQAASRDLSKDQVICHKCGYQNPPYIRKCKNCEEVLVII